ncbi:YhcN/YlaJ family sporulation lipoprotein [Halalkalibacter alkalisediminis]|uniref:YhcN/YlaJ family sporulation lipoprotein n=1 Tax=Halalkalibacter alkalisediminis TaxID=935616 RepID=A0ABV6NFD7_9BACI|nr:YhcN/YlaJ family sporulation lipoprotein [Halalkalibacter alkalisediminis]
MLKKSLLITGLASMMLVAGCQMPEQGQSLQRTANYDSHQPNGGYYPINRVNQTQSYNHYGYQRYDREHVNNNGRQNVIPAVDRSLLADSVTRLVLTNDVVSEAGALVTDKYVLVAYDAQADNRESVADQVKRSALSIVPRYYEVYISDNPDHFDEIERFQHMTTGSADMEGALTQTINEMTQASPQGQYNEETDDNIQIMQQKQRRLMDR